MRMLLRSLCSGKFLRSFERWTVDVEAAMDFESIPHALEMVRRRGLKDMELVLTGVPAHLHTVSLIQLLGGPKDGQVTLNPKRRNRNGAS